jgi:DNA-binding XRE family transcriptional regulator
VTPEDFRAWRRRLGVSQAAAARALGLHVQTVKRYEQDPETALDAAPFPVPRAVELACSHLEFLKTCGNPPSRA